MSKVKAIVLSAILSVPLVALGMSVTAGTVETGGSVTVEAQSGGQYGCCWIFMAGRWYCFPC